MSQSSIVKIHEFCVGSKGLRAGCVPMEVKFYKLKNVMAFFFQIIVLGWLCHVASTWNTAVLNAKLVTFLNLLCLSSVWGQLRLSALRVPVFLWGVFSPLAYQKIIKSSATHVKDFCEKNAPKLWKFEIFSHPLKIAKIKPQV